MIEAQIRAEWQPLTLDAARQIEAAVGVFEIRGPSGVEVIDYASARSTYGLRGCVSDAIAQYPKGYEFRSEVISTYHSRWIELLGRHLATEGSLPPGNDNHHPPRLQPVGPRKVNT